MMVCMAILLMSACKNEEIELIDLRGEKTAESILGKWKIKLLTQNGFNADNSPNGNPEIKHINLPNESITFNKDSTFYFVLSEGYSSGKYRANKDIISFTNEESDITECIGKITELTQKTLKYECKCDDGVDGEYFIQKVQAEK